MALGDAAQVFVGYGNGSPKSVEQDGVCGFGADAGQGKKPAAHSRRGRGGKSIERTAEFRVEHGHKCLERGSLADDEARWPDEAAQFVERERAQAVEGKGAGRAQVFERALDGLPRGVLREVGAEDDLKGRLGRPPVLRAVGGGELVVHPAQAAGGLVLERSEDGSGAARGGHGFLQ